MSTETALSILEALTPVAVFQTQNGVEDIVSRLENDVRAMTLDPTTEKGRKHIKSVAYQVARSKTALDDMGKQVKADAMELVKRVDADRRVITSRLDALRDEVRKPVDDYDAREKARVDGIRNQIAKIELLGQRLDGLGIETLKDSVEELDLLKVYDFHEFASRADLAAQQTSNAIRAAIIIAEKAEADRIETERLAAEKAEADRLAAIEAQKIREAEIARAAAEKARKDAEEQAERERKAAVEALERERQAAARAEQEATARIEKMRREAEENARRAADQKKAAEEQAARDQAAAIERERQRIADDKAAQEVEDAKRAANKAHRGKINREVLAGLIEAGLSEDQGKAVIGAILGGSVPHVTIGY
ncbi:coiled-coil domain-containing protein [Gluconobacter oxydans]|uniref:Phage-related protein n=1 Tax=Gluconobacter oxydans TaxID=442 RepID=A0A149RRW4_GLUOY|nr:hypothetical protein [Gluconobacter oxydans]KXV17123.1 hypothetical protein AD934_12695 [Gluconobacter oxydans]